MPQRGNTSHLPPVDRENFFFLHGTKGGSGIKALSNMAVEVSECLLRFDRTTLQTCIPAAFDNAVGKDCSYETTISSTAQVLALRYRGNIVARSIAAIFLNTELKGYGKYKDAAKRAEMYKRLLIEVFKFDKVEIYLDYSRDAMHKKLDEFAALAEEYERTATG